MNLIEAIKSGRPFRSEVGQAWLTMDADGFLSWAVDEREVGGRRLLEKEDWLCETWEIQEPTVTITRSQFDRAFQQADEKVYGLEALIEDMGPRETLWALLTNIVKT